MGKINRYIITTIIFILIIAIIIVVMKLLELKSLYFSILAAFLWFISMYRIYRK